MKKSIAKKIATILLIVMIFNLIFSGYSYAKVREIKLATVNPEETTNAEQKELKDKEDYEKIRKNQDEKAQVDNRDNPLYKPDDNTLPNREQVNDITGNGDSRFEEASKEVRGEDPGFLSKTAGIFLSGYLLKSAPIFLAGTAIMSSLYLVEPNKELQEAYETGKANMPSKIQKENETFLDKINLPVYNLFTVDKLFFNDIKILDTNVFRTSSNNTDDATVKTNDAYKKGVAKWYAVVRMFALSISLILFIMATIYLIYQSVTEMGSKSLDKSKQLMTNLIKSMAIMLLLPFALAAAMYISDLFIGILSNIRLTLIKNGAMNFENKIYINALSPSNSVGRYGIKYVLCIISYYWLVLIQIRFLFVYINRFYTLGFLVLISPVIATTYALDKVGDNESQILNSYISEFTSLLLLGVIYAMMYIVFMILLSSIVNLQPITGLIILMLYGRIEKTVKAIFGVRDLTTVRSSTETNIGFINNLM